MALNDTRPPEGQGACTRGRLPSRELSRPGFFLLFGFCCSFGDFLMMLGQLLLQFRLSLGHSGRSEFSSFREVIGSFRRVFLPRYVTFALEWFLHFVHSLTKDLNWAEK